MPGKVKVRILSGRNLPVMDRSSDTTDAFAEVRLGDTTFKTDVCRKTLNPVWNSDWFRFDVDDLELQDEPLTIRIMDYDTYSANDAIGKVYIDLNPLLWPSTPTAVKKDSTDGSASKEDSNKHPGGTMCGWLPIFDTMHGVRGEVNVQVKVELFSDLNRFRQSSCGVQFFRTSGIPEGYRVQFINGFVEELVMNDDPEYQWIDKIRTPRASNEARQTLFMKLSGVIQRKIGLKALELGGNAVLGYQQKFDLESDNIVVRGIGTAVTLSTTSLHKDLVYKDKLHVATKSKQSQKSFFTMSKELREIIAFDTATHLPESISTNPSEGGIASALAVTTAIIKIPSKPLDASPAAKPWYRKASFRDAARSIRSVSTGLSGGNSPSNSFKSKPVSKPQTQLHHHRVSSLKLPTDEALKANMATTNSQSVPVIQNKGLKTTESFSSTITCPSTDSSLATPSSLEKLTPIVKIYKRDEKEIQILPVQSNVVKIDRERAVFDIGSDEEDDSSQRNDFDNFINQAKNDVSKDDSRVDTHQVTLINTLLNANMHKTTEGNAIRKQLAADPVNSAEIAVNNQCIVPSESRLFHEQRPILTIEPPSPMPSFSLPENPLCFEDPATNPDSSPSPKLDFETITSNEGPELGYPAYLQKYEEIPRIGTAPQDLDPNRPSPDQDMGCSPRGYNLIHTASEKHVGVQRYSNRVGITQESLELLEYPFITLKRFPRGFIHRFGGLVSCRSVKLLDGLQEDDDTRDIWWQDIRREVRSHARSLGCNLIVGYTEDTVIWEDIIILCASGTAVVGNLSFMLDLEAVGIFGPPFKPNNAGNVMRTKSDAGYYPATDQALSPPLSSNFESSLGSEGHPLQNRFQCSLVHIPYADISLPYACRVSKCRCCGRGPVPDVLISTVEPPTCLEILGRGCLMQATVVRLKKDLKGEHNAREVSDALPFVEYEIHRQLLNKMRVKGMNALFDVKFHVSVNDRTIVALATATGFFVAALPSPRPPKLQQARGGDEQYLQKMQLRLESKFAENMKYYGTEKLPKNLDTLNGGNNDQTNDDSEIDLDTDGLEADLSSGNKDTCVLEIDDSEDADILDSLMEYYPPPWIQVMSTEEIVGISPGHIVKCCQTFSQIVIQKINPTSRDLSTACRRLMNSLYFKLRRMKPCILCSIDFKADLNEENELQMAIYGSVICLAHGGKTREELAKDLESLDDEDNSSVSSTQTVDKKVAVSQNIDKKVSDYQSFDKKSIESQNGVIKLSDSQIFDKKPVDVEIKLGEKKVSESQIVEKKVSVKKVDSAPTSLTSFKGSGRNYFYSDTKDGQHTINLTPLSYVPGAKIEKYLGSLNFFLIRETSSLREVGGLNSFVQSFICEIYSIVRSHVSGLGGNALVSFFISDLVVMPSVHKNQAQCLVHAGGDTVQITYLPPVEANAKSS